MRQARSRLKGSEVSGLRNSIDLGGAQVVECAITHLNLKPTVLIDPSPNAFGLFSVVSPTNGRISKEVPLLEGLPTRFPLTQVPAVVGGA